MAVKATLAIANRAVEALVRAVEARVRELIDEDRRTEAIIDTLKAIFGEDAVKRIDVEREGWDMAKETPVVVENRGYALTVMANTPGVGVWHSGIDIWLKDYAVEGQILIYSPREPWDIEEPGEGDPKKPRAVVNRAILDELAVRLPEDFKPFAHVVDRCPNCGEVTRMRYGYCDKGVPLYIYVEETYPCECQREDP